MKLCRECGYKLDPVIEDEGIHQMCGPDEKPSREQLQDMAVLLKSVLGVKAA